MNYFFTLTVLLLIGVRRGISWGAFDDISWNDVKSSVKNAYDKASDKTNAFLDDLSWGDLTDPVEDAYDKVVEKTNNAYDDMGDLFSRYRKRTSHKRSVEDIDFNSMIETTSVRKSGLSIENEVTFEIISNFSLPTIWMITRGGWEFEYLGDHHEFENHYFSTFTLRLQDIFTIGRFRCRISLKNHLVHLDFKEGGVFKSSYERLSDLGIRFNGPFSSHLQSDETFIFEVEASPPMPIESLDVKYAYFYPEWSSDYIIFFEPINFEIDMNDQDRARIIVEYRGYILGEFLILYQKDLHADTFVIDTSHRMNIPRNEPIHTEDEVFFDTSPGLTFRFPQNIQRGNLFCYAVGQPMPGVEIFKDEVKLPVVQVPFLGAAVTAALAFDGLAIDEVAGDYVCKATSGSKTIEQVLRVEELL